MDPVIEQWPIERLVPYENNPRKNDAAVPRMVTVIREFGFRVPVLAKSTGDLVDGHLRLKAAMALGLDTVPVITVDDMSLEQVRAFRIMINRSATWADWDDEALLRELQALQLASYDLSLTGFDQRELDEMLMQLDGGTDKDPDDIPEPPDEPQVRDGEVWLLGRHRLMCGDSTSRADMCRLMGEDFADMIWTDPPYNVDYSGKAGKIKNDKMSAADFDQFLLAVHRVMFETVRPGGGVYVAHSEAGDGMAFRRAFIQSGFKLAACLIWRKQSAVLGRGDYHFQHEPILYGEALAIEELASSIISVPKPAKSDLHPTTKPVALIERMVANSSPAKGLVLDPFGGSGSTLMACELLGRSCRTMELDPRFAEVIIRRWQDYTDGQALREADGATLGAA